MPLAAAAPVSQQDRDALIKDLENSRKVFLDAIADVKTEAQWNYKPAPDRWSVAECAAHIIAAEQYFRDNIAAALKSPPLPAAQQSTAGDGAIVRMIRDRSQRFQAPAQIEPTARSYRRIRRSGISRPRARFRCSTFAPRRTRCASTVPARR